jgi:hypothetical protein
MLSSPPTKFVLAVKHKQKGVLMYIEVKTCIPAPADREIKLYGWNFMKDD